MDNAAKGLRRELEFAPGKVEGCSVKSWSLLGGKSEPLKTA